MYRNGHSISHAEEAAESTMATSSLVASSTKPGNECWPRNRSPRRKIYKRQSIDSFEAAQRPGGGQADGRPNGGEAKRTEGQAAKRRGDALPWHLGGEARFQLSSSKSAPDVLVPKLGATTPYRRQPQPSMAGNAQTATYTPGQFRVHVAIGGVTPDIFRGKGELPCREATYCSGAA